MSGSVFPSVGPAGPAGAAGAAGPAGGSALAPVVANPVAGQISTDASLSWSFRSTLDASTVTLNNPTNAADGQKIVWELIQDGAGNRALAFGGKFVLGSDIPTVVLSVGAGKRDFIGAIYNAASDRFYVTALSRGF